MFAEKVTIITVCYNAVNEIEQTILSVINQTYENLEYIVVDGFSTDGTVDIIKKYSDRITKWISEPDRGIYDAMMKGVSLSQGKWINFKNCGDLFVSLDVVRNVFSGFHDEGQSFIVGNIRYYDSYGYKDLTPYCLKQHFFEAMPFFHPSTFIRRDVQLKYPYKLEYRNSADYCFFVEALSNNATYSYTNELVSLFECTEGASSVNYNISIKENIDILKSFDAPDSSVEKWEAKLKLWQTKKRLFKIPGLEILYNYLKHNKNWNRKDIDTIKRSCFE